jgi:hypothetical protein
MERSLHRQLKLRYGPEAGGRAEVSVEGYRIDAVTPEGRLIEIQSAPLGHLKTKLARLLPTSEVGVVKPLILARRCIRRDEAAGIDRPPRRSPKRGSLIEVFDELVGIVHLFPHTNLTIHLLGVDVDEVRVDRKRRPGFSVVDRTLRAVVEELSLRTAEDLWSLLPDDLGSPFTSDQLARKLGRPVDFARRVAFCLHRSGATRLIGKQGNRRVYRRDLVAEV